MAGRDIPLPGRMGRLEESTASLHLRGKLLGQRGAYAARVHEELSESKLADVTTAAFAAGWETLSDAARKSIEDSARKKFFSTTPGKNYIKDTRSYNEALRKEEGEQEFPLTEGQIEQRRGELDSSRILLEALHKSLLKTQPDSTERFLAEASLRYIASATDFYTYLLQQGFIKRSGVISGTWTDYWAGRKQQRQEKKTRKALEKMEKRRAKLQGKGLGAIARRYLVRSSKKNILGRALRSYYGQEGQDILQRGALDVGVLGVTSKLRDIGRQFQRGASIISGRESMEVGRAGRRQDLLPTPGTSAEVLPPLDSDLEDEEGILQDEERTAVLSPGDLDYEAELDETGIPQLRDREEPVDALPPGRERVRRTQSPTGDSGIPMPTLEGRPTPSSTTQALSERVAVVQFGEIKKSLADILDLLITRYDTEEKPKAEEPLPLPPPEPILPVLEASTDSMSLPAVIDTEADKDTDKDSDIEEILPQDEGLKDATPVMTEEAVEILRSDMDSILEALKEGKIDRKEFKWLKELKDLIESESGGFLGLGGSAASLAAAGSAAALAAGTAYAGYKVISGEHADTTFDRLSKGLSYETPSDVPAETGTVDEQEVRNLAASIKKQEQEAGTYKPDSFWDRFLDYDPQHEKKARESLSSYRSKGLVPVRPSASSAETALPGSSSSGGRSSGMFGGGIAGEQGTGETGKGTSDTSSLSIKPGANFQGLQPELKSKFSGMAKEYEEKFGQKLVITSGKRSLEEQARLYNKLGASQAAKPSPNAPHIAGFALDASSEQMNKADNAGLLKKYGLSRPLWPHGLGRTRPEAWHVELSGMRNQSGRPDPNKIAELSKSGEATTEAASAPAPPIDAGATTAATMDTSAGGDQSPSLQEQAVAITSGETAIPTPGGHSPATVAETAIPTGPVEQGPVVPPTIPSSSMGAPPPVAGPTAGPPTVAAGTQAPPTPMPISAGKSYTPRGPNPTLTPPESIDDLTVQALRLDVVNAPFAT